MQFAAFYAAGGAFIGALLALVIYHAAVVRPALARARTLLELHDTLLSGGSGSAADRLGALEEAQSAATAARGSLEGRIGELESFAAADLSQAGFVRYDAFAGTGAGLSYALALLNRQGDGVVITSIYSRDDSRTFGKPVARYKPTVQASEEELEAIERARSNGAQGGAP
ncbi:MAG: DUF4446 family protein [Candidatus Eremiobacteraeota bacterium]|nr:DUF4446 family protein [Candidatus Eremiobacteraeota bacterium]